VQENNATPAAGPYPHLPFWGTERRERKVRGGKGRKGEGRNEGRKVGKGRGMPCKNETVVCSIPNFTLTVLYCCPA